MPNHSEIPRFGVTRREFIALTSAALASRALNAQNSSAIATDRHRPRYHLMPPSAWMNDPNGPLYWKGRYHMFYQYSPVISIAGPKYWGHAVSTDLVHWKNLGIALSPTPGGPDQNGCWSGSAVINNGVPAFVYTGSRGPQKRKKLSGGKAWFRSDRWSPLPQIRMTTIWQSGQSFRRIRFLRRLPRE